jgi:hypothetical protein
MNSIPLDYLLTIMYVLIDDWYQQHGRHLLRGKPGVKPTFTDSEVITLLVARDFVAFPGETQFLGFIRANYLALFPLLPDQSQFNRRACAALAGRRTPAHLAPAVGRHRRNPVSTRYQAGPGRGLQAQ